MTHYRILVVVRLLICSTVSLLAALCMATIPLQGGEKEKTIWKLEHNYWQYVQANDLVAYRGLWHKDFLGWPSVSAAPVNKEHITDWITSQTSKGLAFKFVYLKPARIQMTGDIAVACYWVTHKWVDKQGSGGEHTFRVTHTWIKEGNNWVILGGMSMVKPDVE